MICFTELENLPAFDVKGEYLGRLVDLGINPSQNSIQVASYLVKTPDQENVMHRARPDSIRFSQGAADQRSSSRSWL